MLERFERKRNLERKRLVLNVEKKKIMRFRKREERMERRE